MLKSGLHVSPKVIPATSHNQERKIFDSPASEFDTFKGNSKINAELEEFVKLKIATSSRYCLDLILAILSIVVPIILDVYGFFSKTYIITGCYHNNNGIWGAPINSSECLNFNGGKAEYSMNWFSNENDLGLYIWVIIVSLQSLFLVITMLCCHLLLRARSHLLLRLLPYKIIIIKGVLICPLILLIIGVMSTLIISVQMPIIFYKSILKFTRIEVDKSYHIDGKYIFFEFSDNYVSLVIQRGITVFLLYIPYFLNLYRMMKSPYNNYFNLEEILKDPNISLESFNDGKNLELSQNQLNIVLKSVKKTPNQQNYYKNLADKCFELYFDMKNE